MGLILKATPTTNDLGSELYIEVLNATGSYNASTNPGGFGTPNEARNEVALIYYGIHRHSDADVVLPAGDHDPLTVESFTIPLTKAVNGHLLFYIWAVLIYDDEGSYSSGDIVYDNEDTDAPFLKKYNGSTWDVVTAEDLIGEAGVVYEKEDNAFPVPLAIDYLNELNAAKLETVRNYITKQCDKDEYDVARDKFIYIDSLLATATSAFCAGVYNEAQLKVEEIFNYQLNG